MSKKYLIFFALWLFFTSCKNAATLQKITVTPADQVVVLYSAAIQYTATGHYSDKSTKDLTKLVIWSVDASSDTLFSTNIRGLVTPSRLGSFILLANPTKVGTKSGTTVGTTSRTTSRTKLVTFGYTSLRIHR